MRKINMADPHFNTEDRLRIHREIDAVLDGALSMGPNVKKFENEFATRVGVRHAIAMNSCTSTLEASLLACGATGREVIIPAETFIATGMAVHLVGGIPVFAEISNETLCLDINDVKNRVTDKTAAIILVHMAGLLIKDIFELRRFCDEQNLFLIEDAAHAPGARIGGQEAGSIGHTGCFSFFPTKVITAGEGGMLTTDDDDIASFARSFQHRGRDMESSVETYVMPGRNVRMTEIAAVLGRVQFARLDEFLARRRQLAKIYANELAGVSGLTMILPENFESSSFWKVPLLLNKGLDRAWITDQLAKSSITVDWAYQPALHLQPVFRKIYGNTEGLLPHTENYLGRHICLPCHPRMTDDDAVRVATVLSGTIATALKSVKEG